MICFSRPVLSCSCGTGEPCGNPQEHNGLFSFVASLIFPLFPPPPALGTGHPSVYVRVPQLPLTLADIAGWQKIVLNDLVWLLRKFLHKRLTPNLTQVVFEEDGTMPHSDDVLKRRFSWIVFVSVSR